jgi:hypothetical protein
VALNQKKKAIMSTPVTPSLTYMEVSGLLMYALAHSGRVQEGALLRVPKALGRDCGSVPEYQVRSHVVLGFILTDLVVSDLIQLTTPKGGVLAW